MSAFPFIGKPLIAVFVARLSNFEKSSFGFHEIFTFYVWDQLFVKHEAFLMEAAFFKKKNFAETRRK